MAIDTSSIAILPDRVTQLTTILRDTGPGWAEFEFRYDDERYNIGISTVLGNVRRDLHWFYHCIQNGDACSISLYDEPGVSTLSVSASDVEGDVVIECWTEYPYEPKAREFHLAVPRQMLLEALTAGVHPSILAEDEQPLSHNKISGSSQWIIMTFLVFVGSVIALLVLASV